MSVSKKDFIAVARILKEAREDWRGGTPLESIINSLDVQFADYFQAKNDLFDRAKFINACQLED